ncbi:MAG: hypothetical protein ACPGJS_04410 [Flammeovirgaceae bacterium]
MNEKFAYPFPTLMVLGFLFLVACTPKEKEASQPTANTDLVSYNPETAQVANVGPDFNNYWYQGKAEITSYHLEQARYGQIHQGNAILIFVTEEFWADKQVKYEYGTKTDQVVPILKLNFMKKFNTGIYPYSLMSSSFVPIEGKAPFKITSSMQEWCGQAYMQINQRAKGYEGVYHSYFQAENDAEFKLPQDVVFEDAIWAQIRKNPKKLPKGEFQAVPDLMFLRLMHQDSKAYQAKGTSTKDGSTTFYTLEFPTLKRSIKIQFSTKFPHEIEGWEESRQRGTQTLVTKATRKKTVLSPYWSLNNVADSVYRKQLDLP